ncbi:hypothetical protein QBC40DRAFT_271293 [Triangularia verruculosa]|uniref:Aminoglycoside phosphotransferase domain-containing protein n=1 Tax=Triangularia verruculosa TaxID=2587418 RepID=A0AAN7B0E0_9PEZI|nr:hypothetical protein QBC40DRAFT_271293 [Triangularia verruculosa]
MLCAMADREVVPDDSLLEHIFGDNLPSSFNILLNNWDKCIFAATVPNSLSNGQHSCVVRLEATNDDASRFTMVAAMQEIAAVHLPGLVSETLRISKATNKQGKEFHFSVMDLVEGSTLEEVWEQMTGENQKSVVSAIVAALSKLQSVKLSDAEVQTILHRVIGEENPNELTKGKLGGPSTGWLADGRSLLSAIEEMWQWRQPFYTIRPSESPQGAVVIESKVEGLGSVTVSDSDVGQWPIEAGFCHNDVTPRNIMVRLTGGPDENKSFELAGMIDWEFAGFYPPSYQLSIQDTYLGCSHCHLSFYVFFKEQMKDVVPQTPAQVTLLRAMELIYESRQRTLSTGKNVGAHVRKRFWEMLKLSRHPHPYIGWRSDVEGPLPGLSKEEFQKLEDDVIADLFGNTR